MQTAATRSCRATRRALLCTQSCGQRPRRVGRSPRVRELILHGDFAAGARLGEVELAERLGVSRTPVREALSRLAAEGLVEIIPNRGARVTSWTRRRAGGGVRPAHRAGAPAHRRSPSRRRRPPTSTPSTRSPQAMIDVGAPGPDQDLDAIVPLNRAFHDRLVALADHPAMASALAGAIHAPIVLRNFHAYDDASLRRSLAHHVEIVAAVRAGDPAWAAGRHDRPHPQRPGRDGRGHAAARRNRDLSARSRRRRHVHRRPARRGGQRRDLAGEDRLHPVRPGRRRAATASARSAPRPASRCRTSRRCCTARRSRPTRSWRARAPPSGSSRPRASARSCRSPAPTCPGGLAGWIIWPKPEPLAALENTVEVDERIATDGTVIRELDDADVRAQLAKLRRDRRARRLPDQLLRRPGARAAHRRARRRGAARRAGVAVLGRAARAARVRAHRHHRRQRLRPAAGQALRRDAVGRAARGRRGRRAGHPAQRRRAVGGRAPRWPRRSRCCCPARRAGSRARCGSPSSAATATSSPSTWAAPPPTSRWCRASPRGSAGRPRSATSPCARPVVDVRTVGAGGGSIAHVPELTKALRVGPQSAGADPGPAAYGKGGTEPTVTDANVVLGYLPPSLAGGEITLDVDAARAAVATVAEAMGLESREAAAAGIVDIVNENMLGGLRLVSVQQGFDPRDFALVAFGGAGPLHANALGKLTGAWPVIVPPSPGVLCALGRRDHVRAQRVGPHGAAPVRRPRRRRPARDPATSSPPRPAGGWPSRACRVDSRPRRTRSTSATTARASRSRSTSSADRTLGDAGRRVRRRARAAVLLPAHGRPRAGQRPRHGDRAAAVRRRRSP